MRLKLLVWSFLLMFMSSGLVSIDESILRPTLQSPQGCQTLLKTPHFTGLGDLSRWAEGVSCTGEVVVGSGFNSSNKIEGFQWTEQSGAIGLGTLSLGSFNSFAEDISADGTIIAGSSSHPFDSTHYISAFRWENGQMKDLEPSSRASETRGISADGSVIVGMVYHDTDVDPAIEKLIPEAVLWRNETAEYLGFLPSGANSEAHAVSSDGNVIVGHSHSGPNMVEAFRWENGQMIGLGDFAGGRFESKAEDVSDDGSVVVGYGYTTNELRQAFRWENGQMVSLGTLIGYMESYAESVSGDGSVVVGSVYNIGGTNRAFIWDKTNGMRDLQEVLINVYNLGAQLNGWNLDVATAISPDGLTIVGTGTNPDGDIEAWRATIQPIQPPPDLVVTSLEITGSARINNEGSAVLPIRVIVDNQGYSPAGNFKVSVEYQTPTDIRQWYTVAFTVVGQDDIFYPFTDKPLPAESQVMFSGNLTFHPSVHLEKITIQAIADSCSGDELTPDYCRVYESDETNNISAPISAVLP